MESRQNAEQQRMRDAREKNALWKKWGPYLSERGAPCGKTIAPTATPGTIFHTLPA
jgi:hypothetical protein